MDNSVALNGTRDIVAIGKSDSFEIWNAGGPEPKARFHRAIPEGVRVVAALGASNIILLVHDDNRRRVMIVDDKQGRYLAKLDFGSDVLNIACTRPWLVVALVDKVYIYHFHDLSAIHEALTFQNPTGAMAVAINVEYTLVCPGQTMGHVQDGRVIATVSTRGTLVRLWTVGGARTAEFELASDCGSPTDLTISPDGTWVCVMYERGDVHIFNASDDAEGATSFATARDLVSAHCIFHPTRTGVVLAIMPASQERASRDETHPEREIRRLQV